MSHVTRHEQAFVFYNAMRLESRIQNLIEASNLSTKEQQRSSKHCNGRLTCVGSAYLRFYNERVMINDSRTLLCFILARILETLYSVAILLKLHLTES